jgi:hypothetical protein
MRPGLPSWAIVAGAAVVGFGLILAMSALFLR